MAENKRYKKFGSLQPNVDDIMKWNAELPENAKKYIEKVEDLIGAPIGIISVGPDREQTIFR